jgi:D-aminopeptidase
MDGYSNPVARQTGEVGDKARARELGVPFEGSPGPLNAITDIPGVKVGATTIIEGEGQVQQGVGPIRTGVTAILPYGHDPTLKPAWAGLYSLNGNGEMTGSHWIHDGGYFLSPILISNTHAIGMCHHATVGWMIDHYKEQYLNEHLWAMPVVAETCEFSPPADSCHRCCRCRRCRLLACHRQCCRCRHRCCACTAAEYAAAWTGTDDGGMNDINGRHVKEEHVRAALDSAQGGAVAEGCVGGGTGMSCYGYKGGTGTSSRVFTLGGETRTVGTLVQANYGRMKDFVVRGVPVGTDPDMLVAHSSGPAKEDEEEEKERGSIIVIIGTDAPLLPHQLDRLARRAAIGIGRGGSPGGNNSGDIFLAFSTANSTNGGLPTGEFSSAKFPTQTMEYMHDDLTDELYLCAVQSVVRAKTLLQFDPCYVFLY